MEKQLFNDKMIARMIKRISYEILEKNKGTNNLVLAGIKTRGLYIAKRIVDFIYSIEDVRIPLLEVDITPYRDDLDISQLEKPKLKDIDTLGKNVILIDDVLYTGRTIRAAMSAVIDYGRPNTIQLAVIIDRGHRELPIRPDYVGKNVPTSKSEDIILKLEEVDGIDEVCLQ